MWVSEPGTGAGVSFAGEPGGGSPVAAFGSWARAWMEAARNAAGPVARPAARRSGTDKRIARHASNILPPASTREA